MGVKEEGKMKRPLIKHRLSFLYIIIFAVLASFFFTNFFGLMDFRKTSVVMAVGPNI